MLVIPAIDVAAGRLARLEAGAPVTVEAFGSDPVEAARCFVSAGARWLHVVDLDLAFGGSLSGMPFLTRISELGVPVQASGAVGTAEEVEALFALGASRVVLGSSALRDRSATETLIAGYGERIAVGLETDGENIRPRGRWSDEPGERVPLEPVMEWLSGAGARRLVVTQTARVGVLSGPDVAFFAHVAEVAAGIPVIASGGVASPEDALALCSLGLEGVIVGRALYEGRCAPGAFLAAGS